MDEIDRPLTDREVEALLDALGGAPAVTYAPPSIYPMSAPVFEAAEETGRGTPPDGPLGVYVHVPFCNYKCTFCFYATELAPEPTAMERYVAGLERELDWIPPGTPRTQLYVGGGTPTALPAELLERTLAAVAARAVPGEEVSTVECSPESVTEAHVRALRRQGIGRVSMGVQSEDAGIRRAINRRHGTDHVHRAIPMLLEAGLVVNVDLIYGLPGQTEASFRQDVEAVSALGVHSMTTYNLRVNEQTPVGRTLAPGERLSGPRLVRWREAVRAAATEHGFERTRWHTWRRRAPATAEATALRFRDVTGWGEQLGVGLSARSRLGSVVYRNHRDRSTWLDRVERGASPVAERRALDADELRLRYVTLTLGDGSALDREAYARAFGTSFDDDHGAAARRLVKAGVLADDGRALRLTPRGALVYDLATRAFYPDRVLRWMAGRQALTGTSRNLGAPVS